MKWDESLNDYAPHVLVPAAIALGTAVGLVLIKILRRETGETDGTDDDGVPLYIVLRSGAGAGGVIVSNSSGRERVTTDSKGVIFAGGKKRGRHVSPAHWAEDGAILMILYEGRWWRRVVKHDEQGRPYPIEIG